MTRKVVNFGKKSYAVVEIKRGKWLYVATEAIKDRRIDWIKLTRRAQQAKVEAQ